MSSIKSISRLRKLSKSSKNSKKTKKIVHRSKMSHSESNKNYHIIKNQLLDISLLNKNNNKYIPSDYVEFLKKYYKINNSKFPYTIIDNKLPEDYFVFIELENYICKKGQIYLKNHKGQKENYLTKELYQPYIEDDYNYPRYAVTILYFHNVPEEIGNLEMKFYKANERIGMKQDFYGSKNIEIGNHIIKNGTVVIINANTLYKFFVENKLKNEYHLTIVKFSGSIEYPLPKYYY